MIQQYNTVINSLNQFSEAHLSLKRFKSSFFEQIDNFSTSGNTFPILYAIPNDVVFDENIDRMSFRVYCVDILQKDRSNEQSILNETLLVLRDLTNWFREDTTNNLNILNNPRAIPVNNFGVDFTVGWYADYEIEVTQSTSDCSIPFSQNFVFTGTSCDISYVNPYLTCQTLELCQGYIDLDNQLITGGTYNTSASTINLITKGGHVINITGITAGGGSQNLAEVLANGNSVSGQTIDSTNGDNFLAIGDTSIVFGNTAATSQIVLNNNGVIPFSLNNESPTTNVYGRQQLFDYGFFQGFSTVVGSSLDSNLFSQQLITPSSFIVNVNNADRLTIDANKTTVERIAIQNIGTGTSITNLGVDVNGNVVIGSTASTFTGGTVTGSTNFTGGITSTTISTPISFQTNEAETGYTIDMGASNIILYSAGTSTACTLSYSGAVAGQYTLIVDNTALRSITLATSSGWYSNLGIQPNMTGRVFISMTYDGSHMYLTELESMNEI